MKVLVFSDFCNEFGPFSLMWYWQWTSTVARRDCADFCGMDLMPFHLTGARSSLGRTISRSSSRRSSLT